MKVTKTNPAEAFKPITLEVVFETQEEVDAFRVCSQYDLTIPHSIAEAGTPRHVALMFIDIVQHISSGLKDV